MIDGLQHSLEEHAWMVTLADDLRTLHAMLACVLQEQDILKNIVVPCELNPLPVREVEIDEFDVRYTANEKMNIQNDTITLNYRLSGASYTLSHDSFSNLFSSAAGNTLSHTADSTAAALSRTCLLAYKTLQQVDRSQCCSKTFLQDVLSLGLIR